MNKKWEHQAYPTDVSLGLLRVVGGDAVNTDP